MNEPTVIVESAQVDHDRHAKWAAGVLEHGKVMSEDPVAALYSECLDGINYGQVCAVDISLSAEDRELLAAVTAQMRRAAKVVKYVMLKNPSRAWVPQELPFK